MSQIIKGHNKKVTQIKRNHQLEFNCHIKTEFQLNGDCGIDVIYKCTALTTFQPKKCILALQTVSLKSKDTRTTSNRFETTTIRTARLSPVSQYLYSLMSSSSSQLK